MDQGMILIFFGGVSQDGTSWMIDFDKVLFELARWLLPIGICLLTEGVWLEKWRKIEPLSCYRYETVKRWWRQKFVKSLLNGIFVVAFFLVIAMVVDTMSAVSFSDQVWKVLVLWLAHIMTIISFFLVLDLTNLRGLAPTILLLLEGCTFLVGFKFMRAARFMYGMWGMYFQSEWNFSETGVPVFTSLIAEGILLVLSYLSGRGLLKGRYRVSVDKV